MTAPPARRAKLGEGEELVVGLELPGGERPLASVVEIFAHREHDGLLLEGVVVLLEEGLGRLEALKLHLSLAQLRVDLAKLGKLENVNARLRRLDAGRIELVRMRPSSSHSRTSSTKERL